MKTFKEWMAKRVDEFFTGAPGEQQQTPGERISGFLKSPAARPFVRGSRAVKGGVSGLPQPEMEPEEPAYDIETMGMSYDKNFTSRWQQANQAQRQEMKRRLMTGQSPY